MYFVWSDSYGEVLREEKVPILFSYAYRDKSDLNFGLPPGFDDYFIDCGAFSFFTEKLEARDNVFHQELARNKNNSQKIKEKETISDLNFWRHQSINKMLVSSYSSWLQHVLERYKGTKIVYANMDVINNPDATIQHQNYMEALGFNPLPVWHEGEPEMYLDYYCSEYEYICIGGMVGKGFSRKSVELLGRWILQRYPDNKFHFFGIGVTAASAFRSFRPFSTDFSTWSVPARFGHTVIEDKKAILKEIKMTDEERYLMRFHQYSTYEMTQIVKRLKKFAVEIESWRDPYQRLLV